MSGIPTHAVTRRTAPATSSSPISPRSGAPSDAADRANPDRYAASNPACSTSVALEGVEAPGSVDQALAHQLAQSSSGHRRPTLLPSARHEPWPPTPTCAGGSRSGAGSSPTPGSARTSSATSASRVDEDVILVRSRGPEERGLLFTSRRRRASPAPSTAERSPRGRRTRRPTSCRSTSPATAPTGRWAPSSTPTRRPSSPPTSPASPSSPWSGRTTSRPRALAAGGIAVYPRGVLDQQRRAGRGDGHGDGRPAGLRAARATG